MAVTFDEWDRRAFDRLYNYLAGSLAESVRAYGVGPSRARSIRVHALLVGRDTWTLDMRTTPREDLTQGYCDELWADLMQAAEREAARQALGDEARAVRYEPLRPPMRGV